MADSSPPPSSPAEYAPTVDGFPDAKVDVTHPGYRTAVEAARGAGLSQEQFSKLLGYEARRVQAQAKPAAPAAQQQPSKPAATAEDWSKLSFQQQLARAGHL